MMVDDDGACTVAQFSPSLSWWMVACWPGFALITVGRSVPWKERCLTGVLLHSLASPQKQDGRRRTVVNNVDEIKAGVKAWTREWRSLVLVDAGREWIWSLVLVDAGREWREEKDAVSVVCLDGCREREGWKDGDSQTHVRTHTHTCTPHTHSTQTPSPIPSCSVSALQCSQSVRECTQPTPSPHTAQSHSDWELWAESSVAHHKPALSKQMTAYSTHLFLAVN